MKQIDKMLMQAKAARKARIISPVHIIVGGYCSSCKGECIYTNNEKQQIEDNVVVIFGDLPKEGEADGAEKEDQAKIG